MRRLSSLLVVSLLMFQGCEDSNQQNNPGVDDEHGTTLEPDNGGNRECEDGVCDFDDSEWHHCDETYVSSCLGPYALKKCVDGKVAASYCRDSSVCQGGECIEASEATESPAGVYQDDILVAYGDNTGVNCDDGTITVSASEAKRCQMDLSGEVGTNNLNYYCVPGNIEGRYCRIVPQENKDSLITMWKGQHCTNEQLNPGEDTLRVHIIDVGQCDSIWIQTPTGQNVLIDGGDTGAFTTTAAGPIIMDYLTYHGFPVGSTFDAVFLTHPHSDHFGGLTYLFNKRYSLRNYIDPMEIDTTEDVPVSYMNNLMPKIRALVPADHLYMPAEAKFVAGEHMPDDFFGPDVEAYYIRSSKTLKNANGANKDPNRASIMFQMSYAGRSFLFTGDAIVENEQEAMKAAPEHIQSNFLKVGHHGSETSSSEEFLSAVWDGIDPKDRVALISSGRIDFARGDAITHLPYESVVQRILGHVSVDHLFSTTVGDDDKVESETYRDDNILVVVKPDGSYYTCYSGTN